MIYAVNKKTKEHRLDDGLKTDDEVWAPADSDGWIEWHGGECPLPPGKPVDYKMRNHGVSRSVIGAQNLRWGHEDALSDIIAYRPILDTRPEPPAWDGSGLPPVGCECRMRLSLTVFDRVRITYMGDGVFCYRSLRNGMEYTGSLYDASFAPIRSEEDRAVEKMQIAVFSEHDDESICRSIYAAIRDGKIPGVKLTGAD